MNCSIQVMYVSIVLYFYVYASVVAGGGGG